MYGLTLLGRTTGSCSGFGIMRPRVILAFAVSRAASPAPLIDLRPTRIRRSGGDASGGALSA